MKPDDSMSVKAPAEEHSIGRNEPKARRSSVCRRKRKLICGKRQRNSAGSQTSPARSRKSYSLKMSRISSESK